MLHLLPDRPSEEIVAEKFAKYASTYAGRSLLKSHSLDEYGIWEIRAEDTNPDMGGSHYERHLCNVEGTLRQAIEHAVVQPEFWAWDAGGSVKPIKPIIKL